VVVPTEKSGKREFSDSNGVKMAMDSERGVMALRGSSSGIDNSCQQQSPLAEQ